MSPAREGTHRAPRRGPSLLAPAAIVLVCATLLWLVVSGNRADPTPFGAAATTTAAPPESPEPTLPPSHTPGPTPTETALAAALPEITGNLSVAVLDPTADTLVTYNADRPYVTASIVKVDILATLLLQAQQANRTLTDTERSIAAAMIETSDNDAADTLWSAIGGAAGLRTANTTLGLTDTEPTGLSWGLTRTTAGDQVRLLDAITAADSPLDAASRAYLADLMTSVQADQTWGVSTTADPGTTPALKNGRLPRDATGLWVINSIAHITHTGHPLLIAILSDNQPSMPAGITQLESAAQAAVTAAAHG
ncbi:serine hydrolase [Embleya sp. NPDC020886]|uniref:serine hydrolase n=1 Tax=Embleya sp. NPDC020886 TaxID=3363980 RepID=UPI0037B0B2AA